MLPLPPTGACFLSHSEGRGPVGRSLGFWLYPFRRTRLSTGSPLFALPPVSRHGSQAGPTVLRLGLRSAATPSPPL